MAGRSTMYTNIYPPHQGAAEKNQTDVFEQLYENKAKPKFYKKSNTVPTEQRIYEENCTFRPVINESCPFVSERTLRNFANRQRKRHPPPPPTGNKSTSRSPLRTRARDARLSGNVVEEPLSGVYTKQGGFKRGPPPVPNMPIYYFDPIAPPAFESGKYYTGEQSAKTEGSTSEVYEDVLVTDDEDEKNSNLPKAPPLPDWAFTPGGPPSAATAAKKTLVIPAKKAAKTEEAPAPTGWQAVLAEMTRKKEQIMNKNNLKKVEPVPEKPAEKAKKKSKGKKKGGGGKDFKDVMDELNYKLAKLRGEVVEEESDSDDSSEPAAAPVKGKAGKKTPASSTATPDTTTATSPVPTEDSAPATISTPKSTKKGGISFADSEGAGAGAAAAAEDGSGESPAVLPTRKLPSKESMMNLLSKVTNKAPPPAAEGEEGGSISRAKSAPNIAAMLAKRVAAAEPAESASAAAPAAASATGAAGEPEKATPATAKPESIPAPPPIPKEWPPVPHTAAEPAAPPPKPKKQKLVRKLVTKTDPSGGKTTLSEETQELPEGYYMSAPVIGMVRPRHILAGGTTSAELCASLKLTFAQAAEAAEALAMGHSAVPQTPYVKLDLSSALATSPGSGGERGYGVDEYKSDAYHSGDDVRAWNELSPHQHIKERLAIADLPLPSDFHTAVQRMQQCNQKRAALVEQQRDMELRSFLYYEKSEKNQETVGTPENRKPEVTVPVEFVSHTDNHFEKKTYSHRKQATPRSAEEDLPLADRITSAYTCPSTVYPRSSATDVVTTFWLSNLRPTVHAPASSAPSPAGSKPVSRSHSQTNLQAHPPSPSLAPPPYRLKTPQKKASSTHSANGLSGLGGTNTGTQHALAQSLISPIALHTSVDAASDLSSLDEQQLTPGAKYYLNFRPQTQPKAPKLRSDEILNRRQSARKEREERERLAQQQEEEAQKQRKLALRARAMQAAHEAGTYKASTRYHQHQKIFEKYNMTPEVGGGMDIEAAAKVAYAQYTISHHLKPTQGDSLYANAVSAAQRRAAAAASKQHQDELSRLQSLQQDFQEYEDSNERVQFVYSPPGGLGGGGQRRMLHY